MNTCIAQRIFTWIVTGALLIVLGAAGESRGNLLYLGSSGDRTASADFSLSGDTLTVVLTNTSTADVLDPTQVLTGLFFDLSSGTLTPLSATTNGSTAYYGSVINNVGEGYQYLSGISAQGKNSGISTAGLGIFGPDGNFYNYPDSGVSVDGLGYGILSAGDNSATGNGGVTGHGPLFKDSLLFNLTPSPGFSLSQLGNSVVFQYGTSMTDSSLGSSVDGQLSPVPEPASFALLASALLGLGVIVYRRRSATA